MTAVRGRIAAAAALTLALLLTACSRLVPPEEEVTHVWCSFYPVYALASPILDGAEGLDTHLLVQPQDICLRSYTLSDWDAALLTYDADIVLCGGSGLESFTSTLEEMAGERFVLVELFHGLTMRDGGEGDEASHFVGTDPHLYMSSSGAGEITSAVADIMSVLDPSNAELYARREEERLQTFAETGEAIAALTEEVRGAKTAVLHESLFYPAEEYGLEVVYVLPRESLETYYQEDLEERVLAVADSGAELVLIERQAPAPLVEALSGAGLKVARLDVMSTHRAGDDLAAILIANAEETARAWRETPSKQNAEAADAGGTAETGGETAAVSQP